MTYWKSIMAILGVTLLWGCEYHGTHPSERIKIDSLNDLSLELNRKDKQRSYALSKEAYSRSTMISYKDGLHASFLNFGVYFLNEGQSDSAYHYVSKAHQYFKSGKYPKMYGRCLYYYGYFYFQVEDYERSRRYFKESLDVFQDIKDLKYQSFAFNGVGITLASQSNYVEALEYLLKSMEIKSLLRESTVSSLVNIAIIYKRMAAYQNAMDYAHMAIKQAEKRRDSISLVAATKEVGNLQMRLENYDSAQIYYQNALVIAKSIDNPKLVSEASFEFNRFYSHTGQKNKAIEGYKDILSNESISPAIRKIASQNLSYIYINTSDYSSAIEYASEALTCCPNENISLSLEATEILQAAYDSLKVYEKALQYANLVISYKDTLQSRNHAAKFANLRVRLETLEKEMEIDHLRKQVRIEELTKSRQIIFLISLGATLLLIMLIQRYRSRYRSRIYKLEKRSLERELERGKSDLQQQTLHMIHLNNTLQEIENQIFAKGQDPRKISQIININKQLEKDWNNFDSYFGSVNKDFFSRLLTHNHQLTQYEQRVCALIKMNLTNREIATILNIEQKSAKMAKYRIKKKLALQEEIDLTHFIQQL